MEGTSNISVASYNLIAYGNRVSQISSYKYVSKKILYNNFTQSSPTFFCWELIVIWLTNQKLNYFQLLSMDLPGLTSRFLQIPSGWDTLTPKKDNSPLSCWFSRLQNPFSFILKLVNLQVLRPHLYGLKYPRQPSSSRLLCVMRHFGSWKLQQLTPY